MGGTREQAATEKQRRIVVRGIIVLKKQKLGELDGRKEPKKDMKNEGSGIGILENEFGGYNEKKNKKKNEKRNVGERGYVEEKKEKKKKKHRHNEGEDNGDGYKGVEKGNDYGKQFEIDKGRKHDGNVVELVEKKKRKRKKDKSDENGKGAEALVQVPNGDVAEMVDKKKKKKKQKLEVDASASQQDETYLAENEMQENKNQSGERVKLEAFANDSELDSVQKREKKKRKRDEKKQNDVSSAFEQGSLAEVQPEGYANATGKEEVVADLKNWMRVKGFSKVEDEVVKEAVLGYIEAHCLGEEGLKMVLTCILYPEVWNCWKKIGTCLAIGLRVPSNIMLKFCFEGMEKRKWTEEEIKPVHEFQEKHGNQWKLLADELGKHRIHLDASCTEDVDWANLLHHRSGDVCRNYWNQMVLHIGDRGNRSFADQVEVLAK
ncbi:ABC transporter F family member 4-like [Coffea eugenioides]|uniref:ABC transporter F family member 4-like n=1 Tax=Coffea eugenioides TaxID=49369 RepID=UPI000F60CF78|nr:ABC transporter F family member 4-like [Coffea eugenioides]